MDPVTSAAGGYAIDKLIGVGEGLVRKYVIEPWTRKRAVEFYRKFCEALLAKNAEAAELEELLDKLLSDEARAQVVFDAYRSVCLSKSKIIGPRIIAVLVAGIIQRDGIASETEELLLAAAEQLSDAELLAFLAELKKHPQPNKLGITEITMDECHVDSNQPSGQLNLSAGSLTHRFGLWAERLRSLGFISESVHEDTFQYEADFERHVDMSGSVRVISWKIRFHDPSMRLADLIEQVSAV